MDFYISGSYKIYLVDIRSWLNILDDNLVALQSYQANNYRQHDCQAHDIDCLDRTVMDYKVFRVVYLELDFDADNKHINTKPNNQRKWEKFYAMMPNRR